MSIKEVCAVADIPQGEVAGFEIRDGAGEMLKVAVVHTENDGWYAIADRCTHGRVALSEGFVEDECIECPRHGAQFDLASGEPLSPPATQAVRTYPVNVVDCRVYVEV